MLDVLGLAAAHPIVRSIPEGLLGTTITIGNLLQGLVASLLGANLAVILNFVRKSRKDQSDGAVQMRTVKASEDSSLRADLMAMLEKRDTRISELEDDVIAERARCSAEMESMQKRHDTAIAELKGEMMGLRRNIIQEADSGKIIKLGANAPKATERFGGDE